MLMYWHRERAARGRFPRGDGGGSEEGLVGGNAKQNEVEVLLMYSICVDVARMIEIKACRLYGHIRQAILSPGQESRCSRFCVLLCTFEANSIKM